MALNEFEYDRTELVNLTLMSIQRSGPVLTRLANESRTCGTHFLKGSSGKGLQSLARLVNHLHDFRRFIRDVQDVCGLNIGDISSAFDSFDRVSDDFHDVLYRMGDLLEDHRPEELAELLCDDLPPLMIRFRQLLPALELVIGDMAATAA